MDKTVFLMSKSVDKSVLYEGFGVSVANCDDVYNVLGRRLEHGEKAAVCVRIEDELFEATLTNENFDRNAHPKHSDLLQIRYSKNNPIVKKLRAIFHVTFDAVEEHKRLYGNFKKNRLAIDKDKTETIDVYAEGKGFVFHCRVCEKE